MPGQGLAASIGRLTVALVGLVLAGAPFYLMDGLEQDSHRMPECRRWPSFLYWFDDLRDRRAREAWLRAGSPSSIPPEPAPVYDANGQLIPTLAERLREALPPPANLFDDLDRR